MSTNIDSPAIHTGDIRQKLEALWPAAQPESFELLATLLVQLVEGQLSPVQFKEKLQDLAIPIQWQWLLAGKNVGNENTIYTFGSNGQPIQIDAKFSQGFLNKPTGPVIQFFGGPIGPPPTLAGPRVLLCFDVEDQHITSVVEALVSQLKDYDIFLIPHPIESQRSWRDDLYTVTSVCDAAIILLSENALQSTTLSQAFCLLIARSLVEDPPPVVLPIMLNPLTTAHPNLKQFTPYDITQLAPLQTNDPATILYELDQRLTPLKNLLANKQRPPNPLESVGQVIAQSLPEEHLLPVANLNFYASDAFNLYLEPGLWPTPRLQVAWALWNTQPDCVSKLVNKIPFRNILAAPQARTTLLGYITPGWIDPWAASRIPLAVKREPGQRAVFLNARYTDTIIAPLYTRRAYWSLGEYGMFTSVVNADSGDFESLAHEVRRGLAEKLRFRTVPDDSQLESAIKKQIQKAPIFIIVSGLLAAPIVQQLMQVRPFQYATFFFIDKDVVTSEQMADYNDMILFLEPPLDPMKEDSALDVYEIILQSI